MISRAATAQADQENSWDRHSIKAELARRGMTLSGLALRNNLGRSTCSLSLVRPCPSGDLAIAEFLGVKLSDLWPERYDAEGRRLLQVRRRKPPSP